MRRTKEIDKAIKAAKNRDVSCLVCRSVYIDGAHILPRNNPTRGNDPTNPEGIMSLCRRHHLEYDQQKTILGRLNWLANRGLTAQYRYLQRIYDPQTNAQN